MNEQVLSLSGSLILALAAQTELAGSFVRLYQSTLTPNENTVVADFISNEADFDGYPAGGIEVTAFADPILDPAGGYSIGSPAIQFETDPAEATPNLIGGWWIETAGGDLYGYGAYGDAQPMQIPGQGLPIAIRWAFPNG